MEDPDGRAELQRLGARSLPVLSRGDKFVFAQNIAQVVEFLKLDEKTGPVLSPAQLVERMTRFIDAAVALVPMMPNDRLDTEVPNRPRKYRVLAHHMFRIPELFVEIAGGAFFSAALPGAIADTADMASTAALADYGRGVRDKVEAWWRETPDKSAQADRADLLRPAKIARGVGTLDVAHRPAHAAMDDAARYGRGQVRAAAGRRGFRRSADAETGLGRLNRADSRQGHRAAPPRSLTRYDGIWPR